jgi:hypothetical protein
MCRRELPVIKQRDSRRDDDILERRRVIALHRARAEAGRPSALQNWRSHPYYVKKLGELEDEDEEVDEDGEDRRAHHPIPDIYFDDSRERHVVPQDANGRRFLHRVTRGYPHRPYSIDVTDDFNSPEQQVRANNEIDYNAEYEGEADASNNREEGDYDD